MLKDDINIEQWNIFNGKYKYSQYLVLVTADFHLLSVCNKGHASNFNKMMPAMKLMLTTDVD